MNRASLDRVSRTGTTQIIDWIDRSELTVETLASPKHRKIILKVHVPKRNVTPLFWVDLTFEWYKDVMVFRVFIVIIFI